MRIHEQHFYKLTFEFPAFYFWLKKLNSLWPYFQQNPFLKHTLKKAIFLSVKPIFYKNNAKAKSSIVTQNFHDFAPYLPKIRGQDRANIV